MKKILNLVFDLLIIVLLFSLAYFFYQDFNSIKVFTQSNIYYPLINPKSGALAYEKEYKIISEKAEKLRNKTNKLITEMQVKSLSIKGQKVSEFNEFYDMQTTDIFNERDQLLKDLIEIDNKSLKLNLTNEYKEFYNKRLKADLNEYEAFLDYRKGMDTLSKGMVLYEVDEKYTPMMELLIDDKALTKESVNLLTLNLSQFESFYGAEILPLITSNFFTADISDSLELKLKTMRAISNFQIARLSEDDEKARKYYQEIEVLAQNEETTSPTAMFLEWSKEKVQPYYYLQDQKHKKSFEYFNSAYKYAQSKKLSEVLNIWNGSYPGSIEEPELTPTYQL